MVSLVLEQFNIGAHTILLGVQNFLRGVFRDAVYPEDIWHGDATYPRIFCRGVPKIGGVEYPMTPGGREKKKKNLNIIIVLINETTIQVPKQK